MDAYDLYWKIKTLWMNNSKGISGNLSRPNHVKVVVKNKEENIEVVDAIYNSEINAVELILGNKNGN